MGGRPMGGRPLCHFGVAWPKRHCPVEWTLRESIIIVSIIESRIANEDTVNTGRVKTLRGY